MRRPRHPAVTMTLTSPAIFMIPFLLVAEWVTLTATWVPLDYSWGTTMGVAGLIHLLVNPLVAAAASGVLVPHFRGTARELHETLPSRGLGALVLHIAPVVLVTALVHLIVLAAVIGYAVSRGVPGVPDLWHLLPLFASLVPAAALGALATRVLPRWWTPPLVAVAYYGALLALYWYWSDLPSAVYEPSIPQGMVDGEGTRPVIMALEVLAWTTAGVALVIAAASRRRDAAVPVVAWVTLVLVSAGSAAALADQGDRPFRETEVVWVCSDRPDQLCVTRESAELLDLNTERLREAIAALRSLDPEVDLPNTFRQAVGLDWRPGKFDLFKSSSTDDAKHQALLDVLQTAVQCSHEWTDAQWGDADRVLTWHDPAWGPPDTPSATIDEARASLARLMACA